MNTIIFRTMVPMLSVVMVGFSLIVLLRGHNAPGGGFIGALIAAGAIIIYGMARGIGETRRLLRINPMVICGLGVIIAIASGFPSLLAGAPFLTGLWLPGNLFGTPGLFDIGIYLTVFGAVTAISLGLEDTGAPD
jgi:multicomponent Na+:H+ antiporter subunit B